MTRTEERALSGLGFGPAGVTHREGSPRWSRVWPHRDRNMVFFSVEKNPVSEFLFEHGICLPSGCNLKREDQIKISILLSYFCFWK